MVQQMRQRPRDLAAALAEIERLERRVEELVRVNRSLRVDQLSGFYRRQELDNHLAQVLRHLMQDPSTIALMRGDKEPKDLTQGECETLQGVVVFIDLAYLGLFNHFGHAVGDRTIQHLAEELRRRLDGEHELVPARAKDRTATFVPKHLGVRHGGDEFVLVLLDPPERAFQIVSGAAAALRQKPFHPANLPAHADYGHCWMIEAFAAYHAWCQKGRAPRTREGRLTLVKQILLGIADRRCMRAKMRSRLSLMARIRHSEIELFTRLFPFIAKGAGTVTYELLDDIIAAAKRGAAEGG